MEKIKFRAKCKLLGDWKIGTGITDFLNVYPDEKGKLWIWSKEYCWYEVEAETVCQFTGLKDENGKEIFEGDILEITDGDGWVIGHIVAGMNGETLDTHPDTVGAVIGNKFENPEMVAQFCQA